MKNFYPLICGDCLKVLPTLQDESIDLVVTSPPYQDLREYGGNSFSFSRALPQELFRILKKGGTIVWVEGDKIMNGGETLSPFKVAFCFKDVGFKVHDTMIYVKDSFPCPEQTRYLQQYEFMFIFVKNGIKHFNPLMVKTKGYKPSKTSTKRYPNGHTAPLKYEQGKEERKRGNVWYYKVGYMKSTNYKDAFQHPAIFPEELASDHIYSWSNEGDVILDPFLGSGTTMKVCQDLGRSCIGVEINPEYCEIVKKRCFGRTFLDREVEYNYKVFKG